MRTVRMPSCLVMKRFSAVATLIASPVALFLVFALVASAVMAPPPAAARESRTLASGSELYSENCSYCHGPRGAGDGPNAAKLRSKPADLTSSRLDVTAISTVVRKGKRECPSWRSSLGEDEIAAVAAYARSLQH